MTQSYQRLVTTAAWSATAVAFVLVLLKLFAWWATDSVSVLASLLDSVLDMIASLVNLVVVRYAMQPADKEHRFGHGKAESLAALAQAMFISGSACFLLLSGVERLFRPQTLMAPEVGIYISLFAVFATGGLVLFQRYVVRQTGSQAIAADSLHYMTDLWMNIAIMVALGLGWFGFTQADAVFGICIGAYILLNAWKIAYQAVQMLLDHTLPDEEVQRVYTLVKSVNGVLGLHDVRTRRSGPIRFIQLHLELNDQIPLLEAHAISEKVEALLQNEFEGADVIVHQDPHSVRYRTVSE